MDACRLYLDLRGLRVLGPNKGAGIAGPLFRFSVALCGLGTEGRDYPHPWTDLNFHWVEPVMSFDELKTLVAEES